MNTEQEAADTTPVGKLAWAFERIDDNLEPSGRDPSQAYEWMPADRVHELHIHSLRSLNALYREHGPSPISTLRSEVQALGRDSFPSHEDFQAWKDTTIGSTADKDKRAIWYTEQFVKWAFDEPLSGAVTKNQDNHEQFQLFEFSMTETDQLRVKLHDLCLRSLQQSLILAEHSNMLEAQSTRISELEELLRGRRLDGSD